MKGHFPVHQVYKDGFGIAVVSKHKVFFLAASKKQAKHEGTSHEKINAFSETRLCSLSRLH
jgi:hypothetical protein